jgi:hypothetical protein
MLGGFERPRLGLIVLGERVEREVTHDCAAFQQDVTAPRTACVGAKAEPDARLCAGLLASADEAFLNVAIYVLGE